MRARSAPLNAAFYVTDSAHYREYLSARPEFADDNRTVLREWELLKRAAAVRPDIEKLQHDERRLGDPVLWNAIVADRRLFLGPGATREQDYATRFTHDQL